MTDLPVMTEKDARAAGLYVVPNWALAEAVAAFAKLAKRCTGRLKLDTAPALFFAATGEYEHIWYVDNGDREIRKSRMVACTFARIDGPRPKLNGWSLAARIQPLETGERFIRPVPGVDIATRFRTMGYECEHCNASRIRKDVFVVAHEDGTQKQVGRNCIRDFLGHDPSKLLAAFTAIQVLGESFDREFGCGGARSAHVVDAIEFMERTAAAIRIDGWVSRKVEQATNGDKRATVSCVGGTYGPTESARNERRRLAPNEADSKIAAETLAWVRAQPREGANDYMHNLIVALTHDIIDWRSAGVACSGVSAYLRHLSRDAELNMKRKLNAASVHVGAIGERLRDIMVTVEHKQFIDSQWGGSTLIKVRDDAGNLMTWFASGDTSDFTPGARGKFTGTVKAHKNYKDIAETQVNRCKFTPVKTEATAA